MKTEQQKKEERLNELFKESFTEEQIVESYIYLTNPKRGQHVTESTLRKHYRNGTVGTLLRRLDSIAFQTTITYEL